jgi:hypothetical protein
MAPQAGQTYGGVAYSPAVLANAAIELTAGGRPTLSAPIASR